MNDAIVVGARCAGAPLAMLLARAGLRVLAVDKVHFPSDTMSTHVIWHSGLAKLQKWGLLDRVKSLSCPPIKRVRMDIGGIVLTGSAPPVDGIEEILAPRRRPLDAILVDAARTAGAEVREDFLVKELVWDGDRVIGIRGGDNVVERAKIVVGADGRNSMVAAGVKAPKYYTRPPYSCMYYSYWSGIPARDFEMYLRDGFVYGSLPTNDGMTLVAALWTDAAMPGYRDDIPGTYRRVLASDPRYADMMRRGKQEEKLLGTCGEDSFFRKPYGPGWALVGDAGYLKHPITAQGISDAFRDVELLAQAIVCGLAGRASMEEAMSGYEQRRNEAALPMYKTTCNRAALRPPAPETLRFLQALRGNQAQIDRYIGTDAGSVSHEEFFSRANMDRILAHAE